MTRTGRCASAGSSWSPTGTCPARSRRRTASGGPTAGSGPTPTPSTTSWDALTEHFVGESQLKLGTHEILEEDLLDTLVVPSNQDEYLSEIADRRVREKVIRELMAEEVLPAMRLGPAGTAVGLNVQWTLGSLQRS